ncbi:hypothetical protein AUJ84_00220 [Candidatus Pacearchaeota archaeon CG1_02_32_132]|nr:MAG: hypothetical protein AUJ84_00220 [Candidatus Pacearchaeota archaeon CG1_02_32_132]
MIHLKDTREQVEELEARIRNYEHVLEGNPLLRTRDYLGHLAMHIAAASGDLKRLAVIRDVDHNDLQRLSLSLEGLKARYTVLYGSHVGVGA